jgi:hypothetical protein
VRPTRVGHDLRSQTRPVVRADERHGERREHVVQDRFVSRPLERGTGRALQPQWFADQADVLGSSLEGVGDEPMERSQAGRGDGMPLVRVLEMNRAVRLHLRPKRVELGRTQGPEQRLAIGDTLPHEGHGVREELVQAPVEERGMLKGM